MNTQDLLDAVNASYRRAGCPRHVMAAVSGGADSVALLVLLKKLAGRQALSLSAVHVNHQLRKASDDEEQAVKALCEALCIPLFIKRVRVKQKGNLEANAREARYLAFEEAANQAGADAVALAHHAQDQAETFLMRLMHGAGHTGLACMREMRGRYWRPLLAVPPEALKQLLVAERVVWAEDESNQDVHFKRNAVRQRIMPVLLEECPDFIRRAGVTAKLIDDEEDYWHAVLEKWMRAYMAGAFPFLCLDRPMLIKEPAALQRRLLRFLLTKAGTELDFAQTERLRLACVFASGKVNLPQGRYALMTQKRVHIMGAAFPVLPLGRITAVPALQSLGDGLFTQAMDADKIAKARLGYPEKGDFIRPLGMTGTKPMSKYFSDRGVDLPFRASWPLYKLGHEVLWAVGLGVSESAKVDEKTKNPLLLIYQGMLPDGRINQEEQNVQSLR